MHHDVKEAHRERINQAYEEYATNALQPTSPPPPRKNPEVSEEAKEWSRVSSRMREAQAAPVGAIIKCVWCGLRIRKVMPNHKGCTAAHTSKAWKLIKSGNPQKRGS